jgi:ubiquinone/menaquinone biosynthesis C-methylase UbiE
VSFDPSPEHVVDYRNYDFRAVWTGRSDVDRFDQALLRLALAHLDPERTLEIGTGFGRLTPQLLGAGGEYAGVDFDRGGLREARDATLENGLQNPHCVWLAANAYHLPFASGSFSSICMVRVHHHLANPPRALREISRVLVPGGTALITYSDRTWSRALVHDLGIAVRRGEVRNDRRLLFAREGHLQVRELPTPQFMTTPAQFSRDIEAAGLEIVRSYGGAETTAARILPFRLGILGGRLWPGAPVFSTRWVVVQKPGAKVGLRPWAEILACPACGEAGPLLNGAPSPVDACQNCGFVYCWEDDLLDARYLGGAPPSPTPAPSRSGVVRSGPGPGGREIKSDLVPPESHLGTRPGSRPG